MDRANDDTLFNSFLIDAPIFAFVLIKGKQEERLLPRVADEPDAFPCRKKFASRYLLPRILPRRALLCNHFRGFFLRCTRTFVHENHREILSSRGGKRWSCLREMTSVFCEGYSGVPDRGDLCMS